MKRVLLHICCGVCALHSIERLKQEGFAVVGFFFNPNIHPKAEYHKRLRSSFEAASLAGIDILAGEYQPQEWFDLCADYQEQAEGQLRCRLCYQLRLKKTFQLCQSHGFDHFTTTLTISPHKDSKRIADIGKEMGGDYFLARDFKKEQGFKKTMELARQHGFFRQNYCGCLYSQ